MATIVAGPQGAKGIVHAPRPSALWAIALAGLAAAGCSVLLALTSDHIREPGVHAGLQVWGMLAFILAGLVAGRAGPRAVSGC